MIPLPDLKKILRVTGQSLAVAPMDNRGQRFQLSTIGPGARVVGTAFTKADAEAMAALWRWGVDLLAACSAPVAIMSPMGQPPPSMTPGPIVTIPKKGRRDSHRLD